MLTKLAALTLAPVLLVGGVVANSSIMIVEVDTDDVRIVVPVPISLAQVAVAFAPDEAKYVDIEEAGEYLPYLADFVEAIREIPDDVVLVEVQDRGDHVRVMKDEDAIHVKVTDRRDAKVDVRVPLAMVAAMVDAYDEDTGTIRATRLVGALRAAPSGDFVNVVDGSDKVRVRMW